MLLDDVKELPVDKWGVLLEPYVAKAMKTAAPQARCYVFDREASIKLGKFIRACPDVIVDQLEFAIEPYPITYIEVEIDAVIDGIDRPANNVTEKRDWKLGFLHANGSIYTMVRNRDSNTVLAGAYGLSRGAVPWVPEVDRDTVEIHMLGSTYMDLTPAQRDKFTQTFSGAFFGRPDIEELAMNNILKGHQGEARIYAAALLLLHQKKGISLSEKAAHRAMYRGKSRPFMAHNVVTITLDGPVEIRRALTAGTGETRRAHEVPAHYAHRYGTRNCEHVWVKREDEENHWDCSKCGRFRYLRRDHIRGDASKGFVKKSYNVTTQGATNGR